MRDARDPEARLGGIEFQPQRHVRLPLVHPRLALVGLGHERDALVAGAVTIDITWATRP